MPNIRPVTEADLKDIEYICRMTAGELSQADEYIGTTTAKMFSTYYVRECIGTCFCVTDSCNKAVGYILCEPSYKRFRKNYRKIDVPTIFKRSKKRGFKAFFFPIPYLFLGKKYPAHMHIDILPEYQNKGYGKILVNTLLKELENRRVKGLCLITDNENEGAKRFYKRLGFKTLLSTPGPYIMGKTL